MAATHSAAGYVSGRSSAARVYKVAQQLWLEHNDAQGSLQGQEQQQKLAATSCNSSTHKTSRSHRDPLGAADLHQRIWYV